MPNRRVYIVDDDAQIRSALQFLFMTHQIGVRQFASGADFLEKVPELESGCVLLDVRMPDMDGLQVMEELGPSLDSFAAIVMTGHGDVRTAVEAMKLGAIDFVEKPFDEESLVNTANAALAQLEERRVEVRNRLAAKALIDRLTPREREVLRHLMGGYSNKAVAQRIGVSPRTVEMHRSNMTERLGVKSLLEAVRIACVGGFLPDVGPDEAS